MDIVSLLNSLGKYVRSHITDIVPFPCFHHFTDGHNLSLSLALYLFAISYRMGNLSILYYMDIVPFPCFHHFTDGHSTLAPSLSLSLCNLSLCREICSFCIMDTILFLGFHHFTDRHSLFLSCSLSLCNLPSLGKYADLAYTWT